MRLGLWDIRQEGAEETAEVCCKAGVTAHASRAYVGDWTGVQAAAQEVRAMFDAPFALVSNAGIFPRSKILETDPLV
jgi:NAD(P)-dependent dehydrogenase (short-subunit alcohol dehydrogenase family)